MSIEETTPKYVSSAAQRMDNSFLFRIVYRVCDSYAYATVYRVDNSCTSAYSF